MPAEDKLVTIHDRPIRNRSSASRSESLEKLRKKASSSKIKLIMFAEERDQRRWIHDKYNQGDDSGSENSTRK